MSKQQPLTQTNEYPPKKDLLLEAMRSRSDIFGKVVKPVSTISDVKQHLDGILCCPHLFSEYVRLVSTNESLLTDEGIILRNTFLKICPNIPNFQQPPTPTKTIKPNELTPDAKKLLDDIWLDPRVFSECVRLVSTNESLLTAHGIVLRNTFLKICPNIRELTPDAKKLLDCILCCPRLFSECVRLVSTNESLLTADRIVLRNTFLKICPNIANLL